MRGDCSLVFVAEGSGLTEAVLAACDEAVEIPNAEPYEFLKRGVATSVFHYEERSTRMNFIRAS